MGSLSTIWYQPTYVMVRSKAARRYTDARSTEPLDLGGKARFGVNKLFTANVELTADKKNALDSLFVMFL